MPTRKSHDICHNEIMSNTNVYLIYIAKNMSVVWQRKRKTISFPLHIYQTRVFGEIKMQSPTFSGEELNQNTEYLQKFMLYETRSVLT